MKHGKTILAVGIAAAVGLGLYWFFGSRIYGFPYGYGRYGGFGRLGGFGWGTMGSGMMGGGYGIVMLIFWVLILVGLVLLVKWILGLEGAAPGGRTGEDAEEILRRRFARGEIDRAQFDDMMRALRRPR